jgi:hypothetical protein
MRAGKIDNYILPMVIHMYYIILNKQLPMSINHNISREITLHTFDLDSETLGFFHALFDAGVFE